MNFYDYFLNKLNVNKLLVDEKISIGKSSDGFNQMLIALDFYKNNKSIFVVLPNIYMAQVYYDSLISFVNEDDVLFFPADELISVEMVSATGDFLFERIQTLYTLLKENKKIVVMNMHAAIKYELPKEIWQNSVFSIKENDSIEIEELLKKLIKLGYESTFTTVRTGQFSKRGSIVDIFPLGYEKPIRLDFFGDDIESIKTFNPDTQRSIEKVNNIDIMPVSEFLFSNDEFKMAELRIKGYLADYNLSEIETDNYKSDLFKLSEHTNLNQLTKYLGFFNDDLKTIFDYKDNKKIYLIDPVKSKEIFNRLELDLNDYCARIGGYSLIKMKLYYDFNEIYKSSNVLIEGLRSLPSLDYEVNSKDIIPYGGNGKKVFEELIKLKNSTDLIVCLNNEDRFKSLKKLFDEDDIYLNRINDLADIKKKMVNIIFTNFPSFSLVNENIVIINEHNIFDSNYAPKKVRYKSIYKNAVKISKYDELVIGDYVVHYNYGVGKYTGIKTLKNGGIERDYLYIMYANKTGLFIPLEQISNIMKFAPHDAENIKLNEIGTTEWARTKAKVRKRVHDISDKLIQIYASRAKAMGFACPKDTDEQKEFENEFEYELTPDQKSSIMQVKRDMESSIPMDRLVCGDVGYGKTEVALRAAFKMVLSGGKQVLMLAPTTILARQHYLTFKNRMEKYGVTVELLSRFVSRKRQEEVIEGLARGNVDIVVATHRGLSDEIKYKDLGLLIIDEEQRFGVVHKEKIKELKVNIDCMTLSATPIPRTLQMSVMGIKDLSMIETPPKNRYPIQTYVLERNDRIIADAIERELARGGQVFYLYNYTESIMDVKLKLESLVPEARICVGHGKLSKDELERVITKFIDKEYNVLLCTTIIETGIDMPETNTLIIHDADRLGLSQMYQIRGRVGRSDKIAYAYLMYEPRKVLTKEAEKRLETIKEYNELGSGYKIAMRDLSIRGAGDILGEEQSGFIESVGIDVYMKILDEEINKKEEKEKKEIDPSITVPMVSRTIKTTYVDNDDARIYIHKRIDKLNSIEALKDLEAELIDRFGQIDDELYSYMYEKLMKYYVEELDIYKIDDKTMAKTFFFTKEASSHLNGESLFMLTADFKEIKITQKNQEVRLILDTRGLDKLNQFKLMCSYFSQYLKSLQ